MANSTNRIAEGEVLQLNILKSKDFKEEDYFEIISRKTAELFKASTSAGALLANADEDLVRISSRLGFLLGISFQLRDDLLDYSGNEFETGKEIGKDFLEGKVTLPLIKALQLSKTSELKFLKKAFARGNKEDLKKVIGIIRKSGAIDAVQKKAEKYSDKCLYLLDKFEDSAYKKSLETIVINLKERSN